MGGGNYKKQRPIGSLISLPAGDIFVSIILNIRDLSEILAAAVVPQVFQTRLELVAKVLIVSRYAATAHRRDAFFLGCVLTFGIAAHRARRTTPGG